MPSLSPYIFKESTIMYQLTIHYSQFYLNYAYRQKYIYKQINKIISVLYLSEKICHCELSVILPQFYLNV